MLPDLSPTHILIFVVLALLVVGPKDLPALLRKAGQFMARLRGMANEFRASFDEMARQSELDDLRKEVEAMRAAAAKPVADLKDHVSTLVDQSTVSLDAAQPAEFAAARAVELPDPEPPVLPPPLSSSEPPSVQNARGKSARSATKSPKSAQAKPSAKSQIAASKASGAKGSGVKAAPKKTKMVSKSKASPSTEPGA